MARSLRMFLPGVSVHVIQRGNNRIAIFERSVDYENFLVHLRQAAQHRGVAVHGFVLMTTHFHLIATPDRADTLPNMMRELGCRYVRYFNRAYERTGTLWNGRYRSILIHDERYWLTCLRYIEQNPVRAAMASAPDAYRWSSYSAHAFGTGPEWLAPHDVYNALGPTPQARQTAYRTLCASPLTDDLLALARTTRWGQIGVRPQSDPNLTPI